MKKEIISKNVPKEYRIVVLGKPPENIQEHVSRIHTQAILKTLSKAMVDSNNHTECQERYEV